MHNATDIQLLSWRTVGFQHRMTAWIWIRDKDYPKQNVDMQKGMNKAVRVLSNGAVERRDSPSTQGVAQNG